jgi:hypothetical protein
MYSDDLTHYLNTTLRMPSCVVHSAHSTQHQLTCEDASWHLDHMHMPMYMHCINELHMHCTDVLHIHCTHMMHMHCTLIMHMHSLIINT